ncbi:MAG: diguanylate cyclase [Wenzhouxiangella sp.]
MTPSFDHQQGGPGWYQGVRRRLTSDFYLALLAVFTLIGVVAILPFFVFRALNGQTAAALGNAVILLTLIANFAFAWCTGRVRGAMHFVSVAMALGCVYMVAWVGHPTHWVYPTVVVTFMLAKWRFALVVNLLMLASILVMAVPYPALIDNLSFVTTLGLVAAFAMYFVIHTDFHRDRLNIMLEHDALTGALNRRALVAHLEQAVQVSKRPGQEYALAVLDLDDFKLINDLQGHEVGDRVLVDLTRAVMTGIRRGDNFYRLGGEEFVLLLANTDRAGGLRVLEKLRHQLAEALMLEDGPVTVSMGLAMLRENDTWADWLARADQAMYQAKRQGKDCIVAAE